MTIFSGTRDLSMNCWEGVFSETRIQLVASLYAGVAKTPVPRSYKHTLSPLDVVVSHIDARGRLQG